MLNSPFNPDYAGLGLFLLVLSRLVEIRYPRGDVVFASTLSSFSLEGNGKVTVWVTRSYSCWVTRSYSLD